MTQLDLALDLLLSLVARGVEFPEAHTRACMKYSVNGDDLTALYDAL